MLSISSQSVAPSELLYSAFRIAFLDTLERIALADQLNVSDRSFGYLTQVPYLRNVHPGVQLDQLLLTWSRQMSCEVHEATMVDEAVLYAACETAAQVIRTDAISARRILRTGPITAKAVCDQRMAEEIQRLHLNVVGEGSFLLLSQFLDIPPEECTSLKAEYGIQEGAADCMFELLAQYRVSPLIAERARGLLTPAEVREVFSVLRSNLTRPATT
ncbi:MAG: hypothetical protein KDA69_06890 [Planctomycetaceae bacterium]|nr:hypothetical protein [Planctomycetaceae bacterium]MCA9044027.1 hypothetical protein [Planctomycetaceae bacterium]